MITMRKPKGLPNIEKSNRSWSGIVIHHSRIGPGMALGWSDLDELHTSYRVNDKIVSADEFRKLKILQRGNVFEEPSIQINFHLGIDFSEINGQFKPTIFMGRSMETTAAHLKIAQLDADYLGLVMCGDFDAKKPNSEMWKLGIDLVRHLIDLYGLKPDQIYGHEELCLKHGKPIILCPGKLFDLDEFRNELS